jgi:hypothetical protein
MAGQVPTEGLIQLSSSTTPSFDQNATETSFNTSTQAGLEAWIYWHYLHSTFCPDGSFKGLHWLKNRLFSLQSGQSKTKIRQTMQS